MLGRSRFGLAHWWYQRQRGRTRSVSEGPHSAVPGRRTERACIGSQPPDAKPDAEPVSSPTHWCMSPVRNKNIPIPTKEVGAAGERQSR